MTLKERIRTGGIIMIALVAIGFVFLGNQRPVHAEALGSQIVCFVYSTLNGIGQPIPNLDASNCPSTSVPTGGLTVTKIVSGGTATPANFEIHVKSGTSEITDSPQPGSTSGTAYVGLTPGAYTVSESSGPSGYTGAFTGDCDSNGNVTVASSTEPATCTITNTYNTPAPTTGTLDVIKVVSGGEASPSNFMIHVMNGASSDVTGSPQAGSAAGTMYTLNPATYTVSETGGPSGYTASYSGACNGTDSVSVTAGQTSTCTITNTYSNGGGGTLYGGLIVKKVIVGSEVSPSTFSFTLNSGSPTAFNSNGENDFTLPVGAYNVTETSAANFTPSYNNCLAPVVSYDATTTCIITNTYSSGGGSGNTQSELSITKSASETTAYIGDSITYTITVSNAGPATATGVTVNDILPLGLTYVSNDSASTETSYNSTTGVWTIGGLLNGASDILHIIATVGSGTGGTTITNSASVSDTNGDSNSNNTATAPVTVNNPSNTTSHITLTKTVDVPAPNLGGTINYLITASDNGADATGVVVQDSLPSGITFVSTSTSDIVGVYNSTTGTWTIGKLSSTTPATLHITATVGNNLENGDVITNIATVTAGDTSSDTENNTASVPITVTIPTSNTGGGGGTTVTPTTSGGGGGGNGPIVGSYGGGGGNGPIVPNGQVLGASTSTMPASCSQYLTAFIKTGQQNDSSQVLRLQTFLDDYEGANLKLTGVYNAATLAATEAFQKAYGADVLTPWGIKAPTGYVYLTTRKEVNTIYCHFTLNFPLTANQQAIVTASLVASQGGGTTAAPSHAITHTTTSSSGSKSSGTNGSGLTGQTAATGVILNTSGTSNGATGSSTPVTNNPFDNIGNFFSHLFGH